MLCAAFCLLSLSGCRVYTDETALLAAGEISSVRVFSQPDCYDCFYYGRHAAPIVEYLNRLSLDPDFAEDPEDVNGMTIKIILVYENGRELTLYHVGNSFIRAEYGVWYKMDYGEAVQLEEILKEKQTA